MAAEHAAVSVQFVENDVAEIFKKARPPSVMREDPSVQHVWIREDNVAFFANGFAGVGGRIAVVSENAEAIFQALIQVVEFGELVLCEGFSGKEIERARVGIFERRV